MSIDFVVRGSKIFTPMEPGQRKRRFSSRFSRVEKAWIAPQIEVLMPFISYAQNYEDVILWRALRDVEQGFYVDVGAADPEECRSHARFTNAVGPASTWNP